MVRGGPDFACPGVDIIKPQVRVAVPIGTRADEAVTMPIVKELWKEPYFRVNVVRLDPSNPQASYHIMTGEMEATDLALCVADRQEMYAAAHAAFDRNIPIAHVYAGIYNTVATKDDIARHAITLMSDIQFCESRAATERVNAMMRAVRLEPNAYTVGITHFDDVTPDYSLVPEGEYNLILYNPVTRGTREEVRATIEEELYEAEWTHYTERRFTILIGPNPDLEFSLGGLREKADLYYPSLPRPQFLGLVANARVFITNSSAGIYEAPVLMKGEGQRVIPIGRRNKGRDKGPFEIGASRRIAVKLKEYATSRFAERPEPVPGLH